MDKKTLEYMRERVGKSDKILKQMDEYEKAIRNLNREIEGIVEHGKSSIVRGNAYMGVELAKKILAEEIKLIDKEITVLEKQLGEI